MLSVLSLTSLLFLVSIFLYLFSRCLSLMVLLVVLREANVLETVFWLEVRIWRSQLMSQRSFCQLAGKLSMQLSLVWKIWLVGTARSEVRVFTVWCPLWSVPLPMELMVFFFPCLYSFTLVPQGGTHMRLVWDGWAPKSTCHRAAEMVVLLQCWEQSAGVGMSGSVQC